MTEVAQISNSLIEDHADLVAPSQTRVDAIRRGRAIRMKNVVKEYHTAIGMRRVLDGISFEVGAGEKIAVLGKNGAGKSTLVKLIGGVEPATSGEITRELFMSWPIAFAGGFDAGMSGIDNIRFIARVYDVVVEDAVAFIDDFAELGRLLYLPVKTYSSGMRARLAFGLTLAIDFECFLIDEVIAVGDARFHQKCYDALFVRRGHCAMIFGQPRSEYNSSVLQQRTRLEVRSRQGIRGYRTGAGNL